MDDATRRRWVGRYLRLALVSLIAATVAHGAQVVLHLGQVGGR